MFQDFFLFILVLVAQRPKAGNFSSVHCSRGNLVSGLGFPVGTKKHIILHDTFIHDFGSFCSVLE